MNVYAPLVPVFVVALLAPVLAFLMPVRSRVPQVVILLLGGVLIGPQVLDVSDPASVTLLADLGMGFLFLLAGYELEPDLLRQRVGRRAGGAWVTSFALGGAVLLLLPDRQPPELLAAGAIALTTTALGVVLPILREDGTLGTRLGRSVLVLGAFGELGPIVAMAVLLGTRTSGWSATLLLVLFAVISVALASLPRRFEGSFAGRLMSLSEHGTGQSTLRLAVLLLVGLLAVASSMGFDAVLGAFVGGMVLRRWAPGDVVTLEKKLDVVAWGVFIPVFFVSSGMGLDVDAIVAEPFLPFIFLAAMLVVRGGPVLLWFRRELPRTEKVQAALYSTTTLPLLVALTEIAVDDGSMPSDIGAALVGAGVLSVIALPMIASRLGRRSPDDPRDRPDAGPADGVEETI
ncbi:cation:proton antiporter [Cellulosimicrobium marinum]|uniref:cation:proton antiporter n=1 Tax=Cellulosimicrobium marinum TaxID=1638992 RepID=UPI001E62563F|nr:cation:proton antiporter [Cellulosimicrobium marinum]MCB7135904.1 cation:proton antiporter [Cellulosimicrobium marinum]